MQRAALTIVTVFFPILAVSSALIHYSYYVGALTPAKAFGGLCFVTILRFPIMQLGHIAAATGQILVALMRIEKYLALPEFAVATSALEDADSAGATSEKKGEVLV